MLEALSSLSKLRWANPPQYHPLPPQITRTFITAKSKPNDKLELLSSPPPPVSLPSKQSPPVLFLHGGFGNASVWLPLLTQLSAASPSRQYFALSTRNHGASYSVPYLRMVFGTGVADLCADIVAAIEHITELPASRGQSPVLVAHSSAGGLAQYLLAEGLATTPGLVLLDAVPHFGNLSVYKNWARVDPWFGLRTLVHAWHPISPLSSLGLVRRVFFGDGVERLTDADVVEFERWMPKYESLLWPMQMMGSFWGWIRGRPRWLRVEQVLAGLRGGNGDRVCVVVGDQDVLMDVDMCRRAAEEYRLGIEELRARKKLDGEDDGSHDVLVEEEVLDGATVERKGGVGFVVVHGAGHHSQNDVQWKVVAEAVRMCIEQV